MNLAASHAVDVAGVADAAEVRALLAAAGLPVEEPAEPTYLDFPAYLDLLVVRDDAHRVIGAVGLERYDTVGLLRSLVVAPARRNCGIAGALIEATEHHASSAGIELLVLLTETAQALFGRRGYSVIDRAYVPDEVKNNAQFRSLCPASAVCMTKLLPETTVSARHD